MGGDGQDDKPLVRLEVNNGIGIITIDNPPVNALAPGVRDGILEALEQGEADPEVKAMVLMGAGRSFIAGADIRTFGTRRPPPVEGRRPHQILDASQKPVVAAIHGYALGGGLELALGLFPVERLLRPGCRGQPGEQPRAQVETEAAAARALAHVWTCSGRRNRISRETRKTCATGTWASHETCAPRMA